jgi:predicted dinucleotide-binding enzyme
MKIGIIGAGFIGRAVAGAATRAGHEVMVSNTRGQKSLFSLVNTIGCKGGTVSEAAEFGDVVLVAIPFFAYNAIPVEPLVGKTVLDAGNYYPARDGQIAELDRHETTTSEILARHLPASHVVKAFNAIVAGDIEQDGRPAGTPGRRALPIAGDDAGAKQQVAKLIQEIGYDVVDAGPLAEGWRFEEGTPVYCVPHTADLLSKGLTLAVR